MEKESGEILKILRTDNGGEFTSSQMTPQEAWTSEKSSVDHFRVFGCHSYVHIHKDERTTLDIKSKEYIFLGYGSTSKGYHSYDFTKIKVIILSCDVILNEKKFGHYDIGQEEESQKYVYYDCFDDISDSDSHTAKEGPTNQEKEVLQMPKKKFLPTMILHLLCLHQHVLNNERKQSLINMVFMQSCLTQKEWIGAMNTEMDSLQRSKSSRKQMGIQNEDGSVERCKVRLVAQGHSQEKGFNYDETFIFSLGGGGGGGNSGSHKTKTMCLKLSVL